MSWNERTRLLLGDEKMTRLRNACILIVGLGGVGAYVAEMLCRAGIGKLVIVDGDTVEETNRNRQLPALISTTGKPKVEVLKQRFLDINPDLEIDAVNCFLRDEQTVEMLNSRHFDYVVDCIDTLSPKVFLIYHAVSRGFRVISSMGSGGKLAPEHVKIADIDKSHGCKLARVVRKRLHRMGIRTGVKVVYSAEEIPQHAVRLETSQNKNSTVGTISYMPPVFGCFMASVVVRDIIESDSSK